MLSVILLVLRLSGHFQIDSVSLTGSAVFRYALAWAVTFLAVSMSEEFGFRGYVVSDSAAVEYLYNKHGVATDMKDAVRQSIEFLLRTSGITAKTYGSAAAFLAALQKVDSGCVITDVLIKDNSFRIGDSKFLLKKVGHAQVKTVVTNPATGASALNTAYADLV